MKNDDLNDIDVSNMRLHREQIKEAIAYKSTFDFCCYCSKSAKEKENCIYSEKCKHVCHENCFKENNKTSDKFECICCNY